MKYRIGTVRRLMGVVVLSACAAAAAAAPIQKDQDAPDKGDKGTAQKDQKKSKPSIVLRSTPNIGFAPARFVITAEIVGGPDDYEDFYCATVEWDWGDDTRSETKQDCDPYEPGKSTFKRRFVMERTFNMPGEFRVQFRLKQKNKTVGVGRTDVRVRCGASDSLDFPCREH